MEFKGWIPTVTGRLSFDFFGDSNYPTDAICQNVSDSKCRYTIIYQKRNLSDAVLPLKHWAARTFFRLESVFWFVCLGFSSSPSHPFSSQASQGNQEQPFIGKLYIFHDKSNWKSTVAPLIQSSQGKLEEFLSFDPYEGISLYDFFQVDYEKLAVTLEGQASFLVNFSLERNGFLTIIAGDEAVKSPFAPNFPENVLKRNHLFHIVCSQLFFFLRDIGHRHQHHYPETDTIIDLYPSGGDDTTWKIETLRSLCRKAVEFKRNKRCEAYSSALGILAYIKSFQHINSLISCGNKLLPGFNVIALEKAIYASIHNYNFIAAEKSQRTETIRNLIFAFIGFAISFIGLYQLSDADKIPLSPETRNYYSDGLSYILDHPFISLLFLPGVIYTIGIFCKIFDVYKIKITRGLIRWILTLRRNKAILLSFFLSILSAYLTIRFLLNFDFFTVVQK